MHMTKEKYVPILLVVSGILLICVIVLLFIKVPANNSVNSSSTSLNSSSESTSTNNSTSTASTSVKLKTTTTASKTSSGHVYIIMSNYSFSPKVLTIKAGTIVTWTNEDNIIYTVTADNGGPASPNLLKGQSYSYKYSVKGIYGYHSDLYQTMTGTIIVD